MNNIETIAYLAIKCCAHMIINVYDLTDTYPLKNQKKLFSSLKEIDKPIELYISKTDILDKKIVSDFAKKNNAITDIDSIKEKILHHTIG